MLLREFWNDRFWPYCTRNLRESTCVGYESAWRLHVMPCFGGMDMGAISVELVDKWLAGFDSAGAARKAWAVLRAILRRAIRWNLLDVDITRRDIQLPAKTHYEPTILSIRQQRALLQGFYDHPLEAWIICAASCGLRTEEGYGLEWSDIDLRSGVLHVERGLQWVSGHEVTVPPKTELSRRTLPLPRFAIRRLRELKPREGGRLIGPLTPPQAARQYASWCKRHDLPHVPARNLRHSWATNTLAAGADIAIVSKMLGHSDIKTTAFCPRVGGLQPNSTSPTGVVTATTRKPSSSRQTVHCVTSIRAASRILRHSVWQSPTASSQAGTTGAIRHPRCHAPAPMLSEPGVMYRISPAVVATNWFAPKSW